MELPETRYATTVDGVHIAYQVFGEGPVDFVFVNSAFISNVEIAWEWDLGNLLKWLGTRGRVAFFDRRGTGLSDAVHGDRRPTLEARADDIRAVMDAAGFGRAVLYAVEDGGAQAIMFAATHPERTAGLITLGAASRGLWSPTSPWLWTEEQWEADIAMVRDGWGTKEFTQAFAEYIFPSRVNDATFVASYGRALRHSLTPAAALLAEEMYRDTDVRHVLPLIQAPTLVMHATGDQVESIDEGRFIATHIPGALFFAVDDSDHWSLTGNSVALQRVDRFLAALREEESEFDRMLATVLFTDIVNSTDLAAELGDRQWRELLDRHNAIVRALLGRYRGREVNTAGDGFVAIFDGPARAIRCAHGVREAVKALGLEVRVGLHTGEIETNGNDISGIAVHIGARVASKAGPSEVFASQTVKDLVAGSGLVFEDAGEYELKGVPDRWHLYRVAA